MDITGATSNDITSMFDDGYTTAEIAKELCLDVDYIKAIVAELVTA